MSTAPSAGISSSAAAKVHVTVENVPVNERCSQWPVEDVAPALGRTKSGGGRRRPPRPRPDRAPPATSWKPRSIVPSSNELQTASPDTRWRAPRRSERRRVRQRQRRCAVGAAHLRPPHRSARTESRRSAHRAPSASTR